MKRSLILSTIACICCFLASAQQPIEKRVAWADSISSALRKADYTETGQKLALLDSAMRIYESADLECRYMDVAARYAGALVDDGLSDSSVALLLNLERRFTPACDSLVYMQIQSNFSFTYLGLDDFPKVDSVCKSALAKWNEDWEFYRPKFIMLNNWSISKAYMGDMESAESLFRELYSAALEKENADYQGRALANLATLMGMREQLDSALYYLEIASRVSIEAKDYGNYIPLLINMAQVEIERDNYQEAYALIDSAQAVATTLNQLELVGLVQRARSEVYESAGDFKTALFALQDYLETKEEFLNEEKLKAVAEMQEKFETEKKVRQIKELEVENLDAELENERVTRARNRLFFAGGIVMILALGLASRLRYVRKSRAAIQKEKDISEGLLLNILPEEVAQELKEKGEAEAQLMDEVTVLFTDFKGFTALSEILTPQALVKDLNECFSAFDRIMEKYRIEKIKTIGDAYMAAGGLPTPNESHAVDVINAALEMRDFIEEGKAAKVKQGLPYFEIRIGVHTGPVVAGIVGVKKFQYDIWGDTVNTASRMESSGEAGKINLSQTTFALVKENQNFDFEFRGLVQAKGKGELEMYFVERA